LEKKFHENKPLVILPSKIVNAFSPNVNLIPMLK
jgi:hypothetical protein